MSHDAIKVAAVLDDICRAAGVSPADPSPEAGYEVWAALERAGLMPLDAEVLNCPLNTLLLALVYPGDPDPGCKLAVTSERVVLTRVKTDPLARDNYLGRGAGHGREFVPLPPAVKAAVAIYDRRAWVLKGAA